MTKYVLAFLVAVLSSGIQAEVYVGKTGLFDKFRESKQGLNVNKVTARIRVEATRKFYLRECQLVFGNGQRRVFHVGKQLKRNQSQSFYLKRNRNVKSITCFGTTHTNAKRLSALKVFVLPKGALTPVGGIGIGGPGAGGGAAAGPNVVNVQARRSNICVEKSKTIAKLNTQPRYWKINGRGSNLLTWKYRGTSATLTADSSTADVKAYCRKRGSETFNLHWMLNFADKNKYYMNVTVNCIPCGDAKGVAKVQKTIDKADRAAAEGKFKRAKRLLKEAQEMIDKLHEREVLDPEEEALIEELEEYIQQLMQELGIEEISTEYEVEIVDGPVENYEVEIKEEAEENDDNEALKKFLAVVGIIAALASE